MSNALTSVQSLIILTLGVLALVMQAVAFVDCLRQRADAFTATGNQTKPIWLGITGVALGIGVVFVFNPLNLFSVVALVAAAVYFTRVRPAILAITGRGGNNSYGGW